MSSSMEYLPRRTMNQFESINQSMVDTDTHTHKYILVAIASFVVNEDYNGLRDTEIAYVSTSMLDKVSSTLPTLTGSDFRTPSLPVVKRNDWKVKQRLPRIFQSFASRNM